MIVSRSILGFRVSIDCEWSPFIMFHTQVIRSWCRLHITIRATGTDGYIACDKSQSKGFLCSRTVDSTRGLQWWKCWQIWRRICRQVCVRCTQGWMGGWIVRWISWDRGRLWNCGWGRCLLNYWAGMCSRSNSYTHRRRRLTDWYCLCTRITFHPLLSRSTFVSFSWLAAAFTSWGEKTLTRSIRKLGPHLPLITPSHSVTVLTNTLPS